MKDTILLKRNCMVTICDEYQDASRLTHNFMNTVIVKRGKFEGYEIRCYWTLFANINTKIGLTVFYLKRYKNVQREEERER